MRIRPRKSKYDKYYYLLLLLVPLIIFLVNKFSEGGIFSNKNAAKADEYTTSGYGVVHFLDVGQGDCTLIQTHDGKFALIDASVNDASDKILKYLSDIGVKELEYVFFTHPHEDHIGSGDEVIKNFRVNNVIMTKKTENTSAYKKLYKSIEKSKKQNGTKLISPKVGDTYMLSDTLFTVISDGKDYENLNDSSICLKMELGESSFLFTGDAEKEVESDILKSGFNIDSDVYHCGHHGSSTSNSPEFVDAVSPEYAIVSCAKGNDYGHPHREVVSYFKDKNIPLLITHEKGNILIGYNKDGIILG